MARLGGGGRHHRYETFEPPVAEDYADWRALVLLRCDEAPGGYAPPRHAELSAEEVEPLLDSFRRSREGETFSPGSDEAFAARLAIDFCVDYVDGRPLRWSPMLIEMFMAAWVPHKLLPDPRPFERLPAALDAWVRFAGRESGTRERAIQATRDGIESK